MTRSIRRGLLGRVLWTLGASSVVLIAATYWLTLVEMHNVFNEQLRQVTQSVAMSRPPVSAAGATAPVYGTLRPDEGEDEVVDEDEGFEFLTIVSALDGRLIFSSDPQVKQAFAPRAGLSLGSAHNEDWHVFTRIGSTEVVQAAQRASGRRELAFDAAAQLIVMLLALTGAIALLLVFALRRGLAPIEAVAADVAARSAASLMPIDAQAMPTELRPLIDAINELMQRLGAALRSQRLFVADAAHELRTPVTALRLQLQLLERATDDASRARAAAELRSGIDRSQRLIEQLLALSRTEPGVAAPALEAVDLGELVRKVVGLRSVEADHRRIDLGAVTANAVTVMGDRHQLETLLGNLIDNAVAYANNGGRVDAVATRVGSQPALVVVDDGPGIDVKERPRVFDRFYRGESLCNDSKPPGSGLGLAIVKAIADRHGASVCLDTAATGRGLQVRVIFGPCVAAPVR